MNILNIKINRKKSPWIGNSTRKGLVFIPDVSGFTELVRGTDMITGKNITQELLSTILKHNVLSLKIAEIEGDVIFFYNYGLVWIEEDPSSSWHYSLRWRRMAFATGCDHTSCRYVYF